MRSASRAGRVTRTPYSPAPRFATLTCALGGWTLQRQDAAAGSRYRTQFGSGPQGFELQLELHATQPLLLQGDAGFSRKGPDEAQSSHYLSEPQLAVQGTLRRAGQSTPVRGRGWLDHEWSDAADAPRRDRLGLDRHEPGRRRRAHRLPPAPRRRQQPVGRRQLAQRGRRAAGLRGRRRALHPRAKLDQPGLRRALPAAVGGGHAGRTLRGEVTARRAGTGQPRQHRHGVLGRPERAARRARSARGQRLPGNDRLCRPAEAGRSSSGPARARPTRSRRGRPRRRGARLDRRGTHAVAAGVLGGLQCT